MPELTVTEDQLDYLESVRADLAAEIGPYGTVRPRDALQYLIDSHEGELDEASGAGADEAESEAEGETEANGEDAESEAGPEGDESEAESDDADEADETDADADRLSSMMRLLDEHEEKWRPAEGDDGAYEVDLPDGGTESVRTKDDVRAVLFKHY